MNRKLVIDDWDKLKPNEQSKLKELIAISLRAKELRSELFDLQDTPDRDISETQDNTSLDVLSGILSGLEVTNNLDDQEAEKLEKVVPRVASFMQLRSNSEFFKAARMSCEEICERRKTPQEVQRCKERNCGKKLIAERFLNSGISISDLIGNSTEA
jgi:hypothetical protein